jgi:hypothetical protein
MKQESNGHATSSHLALGTDRRSAVIGGAAAAAALLTALRPAGSSFAAQDATPSGPSPRYAVVRRYRLAPETEIAELVRRTEEGFVPILEDIDGFVAYYNLDLGDGEGATISFFASEAAAGESTALAAAWVRDNVSDLVQGPPEVIDGPVLLAVASEPATT